MNIVKQKLYSLIFRFIYYIDLDIEGDIIYDLTHEDPQIINNYNDSTHKCSTTKINILLELFENFENINIRDFIGDLNNIPEYDILNLKKIIFIIKIAQLITDRYTMNLILVGVNSYEVENRNNNVDLKKYMNDNINILSLDPTPGINTENELTFDGLFDRLIR
jgi:hypothetical protein